MDYFLYTLMGLESQWVKCTEYAGALWRQGGTGRGPAPPRKGLAYETAQPTQAIPRRKASMFRGMNLALGPAKISWIICSMVSGLRILVPAT